MKSLIIKRILPLTIISFTCFSKWWYALPVDGPDTLLYGFPLPFLSEGWHTSMSLQVFISELIIDFLTYLSFWMLVVYCIQRFAIKINTHKIVTIVLWVVSGFILAATTLIAGNPNNIYYTKRPFELEIMDTGYHFIWQQTERPDYYKYHPKNHKE